MASANDDARGYEGPQGSRRASHHGMLARKMRGAYVPRDPRLTVLDVTRRSERPSHSTAIGFGRLVCLVRLNATHRSVVGSERGGRRGRRRVTSAVRCRFGSVSHIRARTHTYVHVLPRTRAGRAGTCRPQGQLGDRRSSVPVREARERVPRLHVLGRTGRTDEPRASPHAARRTRRSRAVPRRPFCALLRAVKRWADWTCCACGACCALRLCFLCPWL